MAAPRKVGDGWCRMAQLPGERSRLQDAPGPGDLQTESILQSWLQNPPDAPQAFEDARLLQYRHPREGRSFWVALGLLLAALVVVPAVSSPYLLAVILLLWGLSLAASFVFIAQHIA